MKKLLLLPAILFIFSCTPDAENICDCQYLTIGENDIPTGGSVKSDITDCDQAGNITGVSYDQKGNILGYQVLSCR